MTYEEIVSYSRRKLGGAKKVDTADFAVQINLTGEGEGAFYVEVKGGKAKVEPYEYFDRAALVNVSSEDYLAVLDGKKDVKELNVEGDADKVYALLAVKKAAAKKAPAKKAPAKKAPAAKKPAAKKAPAKKAPAAKKPAAKKAPAAKKPAAK